MRFLQRLKQLAMRWAGSGWALLLRLRAWIGPALTWLGTVWARFKLPITSALVVAVLSLCFTAYNALMNPPNSWFRQHIWPRVDLVATSRDLSIDDQAAFEVLVNTLPAKDQYRCHWTILPTRPGDKFMGGIQQDNCSPVPLRNFGTAFEAGEQERTIEVAVAVTGNDSKNIGHEAVGLTLRNRTRPTIGITPDTIRLGDEAQIIAYFRALKSPVTSPYRCAWVIGGNAVNSDNCSISHKAIARLDSPAKEIIDVRLLVRDAAGNVVGEGQRKLSIVWPTGDFYVYAIETTTRMNGKARGVTLASSVSDLEKSISTKSLATASVGIKAFGRADPPNDRNKCGLVEDLYALAPLDGARVKNALAGVTVNGFRAPVLHAAEKSLEDLTKHAQHNAWLYLVLITGGPDDCGFASGQDPFNKIASTLESATVRVGPIDIQVLGLTLRLASPEEGPLLIERTWSSSAANGKVPSFQLVVTSADVLNQALGAVAGLANANAAERRASCARLVTLLRQQPDLPPNLRERRNPQAEKMESWCRKERI